MKQTLAILLAIAMLALGLTFSAQAGNSEAGASETGVSEAGETEAVEFEAPEDGLEINFIKGHSEGDLAVEFNHSSHASFDCIDCHHKMGELKGKKAPRSCASCHDNFSPDDLKGYKSYFKAMHKIRFEPNADRASCLGCHVKEFGSDDKDMTGCVSSACHPGGIR